MKKTTPLKQYLSIRFSLVAIFPFLVLAFLIWQFFVPQVTDNIDIQHQSAAEAIAGQIIAHLHGGERQLLTLSEYVIAGENRYDKDIETLLDAGCGQGEMFETIYIASRPKQTVLDTGLSHLNRRKRENILGLDLSGRKFLFTDRKSWTPAWSHTFLSTVSARMAVALTISVKDLVFVGEVTLDRLSEVISQLPVKGDFTTMVLDRNSRIIADSSLKRIGERMDISGLAKKNGTNDGSFASVTFDLGGEKMLGALVKIKALGWNVLVAQSVQTAYKPLTAMFFLLVSGIGIALGLALSIAWIQAGIFSRHIKIFTRKAQKIAQGEYNHDVPFSKTSELTALGQNIIQMAGMIKQRETALIESQMRLAVTLDSIGDAVIATDTKGRITFMNPMAETLTAWPEKEAIGRPLTEVFNIVNALTQRPVDSPFDRVMETGKIVGLVNQTLLKARNGNQYQISDSGAPIRRADGETIGVVLVFRDVTKEYAREQALKITQSSFDNAATGIFLVTEDGMIKTVNVIGAKQVGYTIQELAGRHISIIDPEIDRPTWQGVWKELRVNSQLQSERFHLTKNGGKIPVLITSNLIEHYDSQFSIVFVKDITQQKKDLAELDRLQQYLTDVFDSMPSALIGVDKSKRITHWNKAMAEQTGILLSDAVGSLVTEIVPRLSGISETIENSLTTREVTQSLRTRYQKDGALPVYEDFIVYPLTGEKSEGAVILIDDVTEKVRMEEMLIQNEKILSVGGLAAGMAHEINNPLAGIIQNSSVLENRLTDRNMLPNIKAAESLGTDMDTIGRFMEQRGIPRIISHIKSSGDRMSGIVNNMLSFARKSESSFSIHDPVVLIDKILELAATDYDLKKKYDFKSIRIEKAYAENLPMVPCESSKIQQVILNILNNGAYAMFERSKGVQPKFILRLNYESDPDMLRIEIEDNGPGMAPDTFKRIFEPFFTTKPIGVGTGLGLSVSYFIIVENHSGSMDVISAPGQGAKFIIRLPVKGKAFVKKMKVRWKKA